MATQVFHLGDLTSGHFVKGPAILLDNNRFEGYTFYFCTCNSYARMYKCMHKILQYYFG